MKKILIFVLCLMPFVLMGQSSNVRMIVDANNEVTFWRGQQQLSVRGYTGEPIYTANHYVAVNGNDNNAGTFTAPWATWQKAFDNTAAGELTYIRGGTYYQSITTYMNGVDVNNRDGTAGNLIRIFNYPGEIPILDRSNCVRADANLTGVYMASCDYWHIKGLRAIKTPQFNAAYYGNGFTFTACTNFTVEQCVAYENSGSGFVAYYANNFLFKNCDSYNNNDVLGENNGNGFALVYTTIGSTNTLRGCRSWNNTWGEGFGTWLVEGIAIYDSCWAWGITGTAGDGAGFELGYTAEVPSAYTQRIVTNCIAANNDQGFNQASANVIFEMYNNVAYDNSGYGFYLPAYSNIDTVRNNIGYLNSTNSSTGAGDIVDHNSWQGGITVSAADFVSLDLTQLDNPRASNGNLPVITLFHLVTGSDLKNAGVDVGIPYMGAAPDIGCFEFVE